MPPAPPTSCASGGFLRCWPLGSLQLPRANRSLASMVAVAVESIKKPLLHHQGILPSIPSRCRVTMVAAPLLATTSSPRRHSPRARALRGTARRTTMGHASLTTSSSSCQIKLSVNHELNLDENKVFQKKSGQKRSYESYECNWAACFR